MTPVRAIRLCCLTLGVAAASFVYSGCTSHMNAQTPANSGGQDYSVARVDSGRLTRSLRVGGTTAAVHDFTVRIPQVRGQGHSFTLVTIVDSGAKVQKGQVLATFDSTQEVQNALDAKAKYDGLAHQVDDLEAQNAANAAARASALRQAETDLSNSQLELKKGPVLSQIQKDTDQINVDAAQAHISSLKRQNVLQERADQASLRVMELQRDQQKVEWDRAQATVDAMTMRAPISGMVGLVPVRRSDGMGPAEPGDSLHSGQSLVRIFDPGDMLVEGQINEADDANLTPGLKGVLHLDAYPGVELPVHFVSASPVAVATGGFGNTVRTFSVRFHVDKQEARLLPDLSAAVDLKVQSAAPELLVPRHAVHFTAQQPYVSKRNANGQWVEQAVELGNFDDQQVEILRGLKTGDQVKVPQRVVGEGQ
ncbi:MAG TPA: efflux RND transporter periplasmic adaptor subunit [Terriglobales bacterium]